ncbi:hypothetical protein M9H77_23255 [Catharanthus roseus]|uniref:Uncharacterized protein n=1 Tax=Catharanthus roseus TaxID=4058 RepID=A0ACC0AVB5_CATRO|nr:hypothetical protein M9H77_23255 [Catharanthus roseus]
MTRARMKKLKASNGNEDNGMVVCMEEALKKGFGEFGDQGKASKLVSFLESIDLRTSKLCIWGFENPNYNKKWIYIKAASEQPPVDGFVMSTEGRLPTQSHQEGTSDPTRMNLNETLRSMQESIKVLARIP